MSTRVMDTWTDPGVTSLTPGNVRHALNGLTMGTRYSAVFVAPADIDLFLIQRALQSAADAVDRQMSNWQPASDVSQFNSAPAGTWVAVAADLLEVVETGLEIGRRSNGAFDIGLGNVVNAWGFGPERSVPDAAAIAALSHTRQASAGEGLELDRRNIRMRRHAPMQLDLCGIAKGFGVDQLARCLDASGIRDYLVSIDGELRARGSRLDGAVWQVAIERPDRTDRAPIAAISLHDVAIATSGDYRHSLDYRGRRFSHTMDPRTERPLDNSLASVSVLAASAMLADAWATALFVAGENEGPVLAEANGLDALFILRQGDELLELPIGKFE
ncbi:thiamine biosynthesis lipoprotein [Devosia psychrophila]|uniref:FAD:protein FMN transferase n=2 Tax=Devosia psychrophila TaxID=728005 RepID=A0A1I1QBN9_9HYPH|nr:thiamine biosynthesis lipoprotein [Devosia psychrophila]